MSKPDYESIFDLLILFLLVFFVVMAFKLSGGAGRVPLMVGIPTLILMGIKLAISVTKKTSLKTQSHQSKVPEPAATNEIGTTQNKILNEIIWLFIFTLIIVFLGVLLGSLVYLMMYLRLHNKDSWRFSITVSMAVAICAYFIFQQALQMQLYEGVLPSIVLERFDY